MEMLQVRQRWMTLPWGAFLLAIMLVFAAIGIYSTIYYPDDKPSIRLIMPMYAIGVYIVFALIINWRTTVVTPRGLTLSVWPFIVRPPRHLTRDKIRYCYIRNVSNYDDGTLLETYYSAGVQSIRGEQIDISTPHATVEEAVAAANTIANVLNQAPGHPPLEVMQVEQLPEVVEILMTLAIVGFWLALLIASVFVGFEWERSSPPPFSSDRERLKASHSASSANSLPAPSFRPPFQTVHPPRLSLTSPESPKT